MLTKNLQKNPGFACQNQNINNEALVNYSIMQVSHSVKFWGVFLSFSLVSLGAVHCLQNMRLSRQPELSFMETKKSLKKFSQAVTEKSWGHVGALAYQAGNQLMASNNAKPQSLDVIQKQYLRPHFGDLVDRVVVVYSAVLMEDWVAASFKINVGESNAQVYGHRIYIKDIYRPGDLNQIVLLAHELYHCKQYEELGSLSKFGYHYFLQYKKGDEIYENNIFEQEAFKFEKYFADWLTQEVRKQK
jgi:hypothetical protein